MERYLLSLLLAVLAVSGALAQGAAVDLTGEWKGQLLQPGSTTGTDDYIMTLSLTHEGERISGISRIQIAGTEYYGLMRVEGTLKDGALHFREKDIIEDSSPSELFRWCIKQGDLLLARGRMGDSLSGPWTSPGCVPGTVTLQRVRRAL